MLLPVCPTVMLLPRPTPEVTVMVVPVLFTSVARIPAAVLRQPRWMRP
ncbi:hypothetical protein ACFYW8_35700 [Streptomyces sp. NPDC002742]|jgi:hypothetical protein